MDIYLVCVYFWSLWYTTKICTS